jgi:PEP-CTERM motif
MSLKKWLLTSAVVLLTAPMFGSTYYGGLEDWTGLDYDYNDVVFSLSGSNLTLHSSGQWYSEPTLGTSGGPFWNRSSMDGANYNVGYCIYGGGSCNGGAALDAGAKYLAMSANGRAGSVNNVTFTADGVVVLTVALQVTAAKDDIGWYSLSDPQVINWLDPKSANGQYSFDPHGAFGLVGGNSTYDYYSNSKMSEYFSKVRYGSRDDISHFAFFSDPPTIVPEPGMTGLMSLGLLGSGILFWRRKRR